MNVNLINRPYLFEIRSEMREDGTALLTGLPIVYNSAADIGGYFREIISPGALNDADMTDVPLFVNHNDRMIPVARSRRNTPNSTLRLMPSADGLRFEADLDVRNNGTASELNSAVSRGDIAGMSVAFTVKEERWENLDTDYPTRYIDAFDKIFEISACTHPAYEATEIFSVRDESALDNARAALDSAKRSATPDGGNTLEILKLKTKILTMR